MNLYHYCSNAALISILSTREIFASQLSLSNDVLEGKWIREVFLDYCSEKGVIALELEDLLNQLDIVINLAAYAGFCMSEEGDLLSQWRGYADDAAGVSIGFNKEYFENLGTIKRDRGDEFSAHLTQVEYSVYEQKRLVGERKDEILKLVADGALRRPTLLTPDEDQDKWKKNFRTMGLHFVFFYFFLFKLKNPAFSEEREWRVISHLLRGSRDNDFGQLAKMEFRSGTDRIVPFTRIALEKLPQPSITEIILGPRNATPEHVIEALLVKSGWPDVLVRRSKASYRPSR